MGKIIPVDTDIKLSWDEVFKRIRPVVMERMPVLQGLPLAIHMTYDNYGLNLHIRVMDPPKR